MILILAALIVLALAALAVAYWGAGVILHPPGMSKMEVFPEQFGLRYEKAAFKTSDGITLKGWFIPSPHGAKEDRTILMCHGWSDNKGELLKMTYFLNTAAGFNLFYFDNRSHGESGGTVTTVGALEVLDFDAAVGYLKSAKPRCLKHLGIFGFSMGAAVSAVAASRHPEIKAVALESPYTEFHTVVAQWAKNHMRLPYFPLVMLSVYVLRLRVGGRAVDNFRPIRSVPAIAPRPLLVLGGSEDRLMPEHDVRALYRAAKSPKELWIIPGAGHAKCREFAGPAYERRLSDFFDKHL